MLSAFLTIFIAHYSQSNYALKTKGDCISRIIQGKRCWIRVVPFLNGFFGVIEF